jgi:hypothetical protein
MAVGARRMRITIMEILDPCNTTAEHLVLVDPSSCCCSLVLVDPSSCPCSIFGVCFEESQSQEEMDGRISCTNTKAGVYSCLKIQPNSCTNTGTSAIVGNEGCDTSFFLPILPVGGGGAKFIPSAIKSISERTAVAATMMVSWC